MANEMDKLNDLSGGTVEQVVDASKKVKIGIIGCGWIAGSHIDSYKKMADVEVVACADLIPGKAEAFCKANGITARCYENGHAMLEAEELDGVSIEPNSVIGITAGASTPDCIFQEVVAKMTDIEAAEF